MINRKYKTKIMLLVLSILLMFFARESFAANGSFYNQDNMYRGFYWFEVQEKEKKQLQESNHALPTPEEASASMEARKLELDNARNVMLELSYREDIPNEVLRASIVKYKKLEAKMYGSAIRLSGASDMANFTNPELVNYDKEPTNVFANKIKRRLAGEEKLKTIKEFGSKFDLLLFANNDCPYSKGFVPIATRFANNYGYDLDITSLESSAGAIAAKLGITSTPTLVAISKDATQLFEIARGYVSLSELEESIVLSQKYSDELAKVKKR